MEQVSSTVPTLLLICLLGQPQAARAAGRAIGVNPLAPLIPCHRVVGANGSLTGYRWGIALKRWLLALEGVCLPD